MYLNPMQIVTMSQSPDMTRAGRQIVIIVMANGHGPEDFVHVVGNIRDVLMDFDYATNPPQEPVP
jgi:hypothetical protein